MILDDIISDKQQEVTALKAYFAGKDLDNIIVQLPVPRDFLKAFHKGRFSLIAELKKASPSAGVIREKFEPITLAKTYEESGATAISVLTDKKYFQGKLGYLKAAKDSTTIPILRKDFIIDEAQLYESRIAGADGVLLIARVLNDNELERLLKLARKLGMEAVVEVHNADEVKRALKIDAKIVGINNRDLDTFKVDLNITLGLVKQYPGLKERIVISESGIETRDDILRLKQAGVDGVLIGEALMKSNNIPAKIGELLGYE
ncbi:MAG: indole-3-glycerol phosphate synthase TrpC [Candidatus Margulisbacteria bacterium]|nr:indole-3-glycerol phosphate synthase TrpC [Candidatus Margulisiibacteriota bacterium]